MKHITESYVAVSNFLRDPKEVDENLPGEDVSVSLQIQRCPRHQLLSTYAVKECSGCFKVQVPKGLFPCLLIGGAGEVERKAAAPQPQKENSGPCNTDPR